MVANWLKVVWILVGGTAAAAGAAYVGGVFEPSPGSPRVEAAVQQTAAGQAGSAKTDGAGAATGDKADGGQQVASLPPAESAAEAGKSASDVAVGDVVVPAFDLVRVEPDGSVVIAGTAAAGAAVEVIAGATVIGTATAGEGGDFAVVLDDPLKPGDYTIVLRTTTGDNIVATSTQTAVISVPETESGQVLALVEEPGAPSRLITVPSAPRVEPAAAAAKGDRPAAQEPVAGEMAADAAEPKPQEMQAEATPSAETQPAQPEGGLVADNSAPAEAPAQQQVAAVEQPKAETDKPAAVKAAPARVAVEAVEIEGRDVFVAGFAEAGSTVRVYANDVLLGQATASETGRFLIEAEKDLPVGDYIVRADMLGADKSEVLARAAVPFEREPGDKVAAVAAPAEAPADTPRAGGESAADAVADTAPKQEMAKAAGEASGTTSKAREMAADAGSAAAGDKGDRVEVAALGGADDPAKKDTMSDAASPPPTEATAPKLQNVGGAVIIRRGDTLWRLSRRVYGRGVRYTTIYLANQDQIADPDRIWPGQVFAVPGETDEGEAADMSAVAEQVADENSNSDEVVTR